VTERPRASLRPLFGGGVSHSVAAGGCIGERSLASTFTAHGVDHASFRHAPRARWRRAPRLARSNLCRDPVRRARRRGWVSVPLPESLSVLGDEHCPAARPACDAIGECIRCASDEACVGSRGGAICELATGACRGCAADAECSNSAAAPVCNESTGVCVACTADTAAAHCGGNSCSPATHACTSTPIGSVGRCQTCQADAECGVDLVCVPRAFQGAALGSYCLPKRTGASCGDTGANTDLLPYSLQATVTTVDGAQVAACVPREEVSCEAIRRLGTACVVPMSPDPRLDACGSSTVHDGACGEISVGMPMCTYVCTYASDCATGNCAALAGTGPTVCQ
jgi:hypothetical protein